MASRLSGIRVRGSEVAVQLKILLTPSCLSSAPSFSVISPQVKLRSPRAASHHTAWLLLSIGKPRDRTQVTRRIERFRFDLCPFPSQNHSTGLGFRKVSCSKELKFFVFQVLCNFQRSLAKNCLSVGRDGMDLATPCALDKRAFRILCLIRDAKRVTRLKTAVTLGHLR